MTFLPDPEIPYKIVHTGDIFLLLSFGFVYELCVRLYQHRNERPTPQEHAVCGQLAALRYETVKKRKLGTEAFVETSKLQRATLSMEKELANLAEERYARTARVARRIRKLNFATNGLILLTYWGVAMIVIGGPAIHDRHDASSPGEVLTDTQRAAALWKGFMFPLSYMGMTYKIAQYGIHSDMKSSCAGALTVVWAARVTCGEMFECVLEWMAR